MRIFHCDRCGTVVPFSADGCTVCGAALAYVDDERTIRVLIPADDAASYTVGNGGRRVWRCLNAAWRCNWVVPAGTGNAWCRSCQLTRGRPDEHRPAAMEAWMTAEAAKRRLVHQLDEIGLPIEARSPAAPDGLAFDLVHLPGEGGLTGHLDGIVTLDLAEADEQHREDLRRRLDEPFRTLIGHLRHEIGHHYWRLLVDDAAALDRCRALFGDERTDYATAIDGHYAGRTEPLDGTCYITAYAASHPYEDWAETFAHYLHMIDALDTAAAHAVTIGGATGLTTADAIGTPDFGTVLAAWRPVNSAVNAIAESLGAPAVYPFEPTGAVVDKLAFVHDRVVAHTAEARARALG